MPLFSITNFTNSDGFIDRALLDNSLITYSNASTFVNSPARRRWRCPAASLPRVTLPMPRGGEAAARILSTSREGSIANRIHARTSFTSLRPKNRVPRTLYAMPARSNPSSSARDWKLVRKSMAISSAFLPSASNSFIFVAIQRASSSAFIAACNNMGSPSSFSVVDFFSLRFLFFSITAFAASTKFLVER